ncbi:gastrula zinc finger protein XlCGF53.1-like isoform X1 [Pelobates fuscus]|uniref:gastrula zinc finger protein XlCGF53.1-like isoform X1 n=1 Tax=Pelobates fuscus TaxID=191477 RepID=UPI002FE45490
MMNKARNMVTEKILDLTMEIISLLTGEDYMVLKKSPEHVTNGCNPCVSEVFSKVESLSMVTSSNSPIHEKNHDQKILELTNKIIQLLTEEVPIRCGDVAVFLSMEEWEYLEDQKDNSKDHAVQIYQPLNSLDGDLAIDRNERHYASDPQETFSYPITAGPGSPKNGESAMDSILKLSESTLQKSQETVTLLRTIWPESPENGKSTDRCIPSGNNNPISVNREKPDMNKRKYLSKDDPLDIPCKSVKLEKESILAEDHFLDLDIRYPKPNRDSKTTSIKQEPTLHEDTNAPTSTECTQTDFSFLSIKEESVSHDGDLSDDDFYSSMEHTQTDYPSAHSSYDNIYSAAQWRSDSDLYKNIRTSETSCSECGKCFENNTNLGHKTLHTGGKPFSCSTCWKRFYWRTQCLEHQRTHTGKQPFSCSECEKSFANSAYLVIHQGMHENQIAPHGIHKGQISPHRIHKGQIASHGIPKDHSRLQGIAKVHNAPYDIFNGKNLPHSTPKAQKASRGRPKKKKASQGFAKGQRALQKIPKGQKVPVRNTKRHTAPQGVPKGQRAAQGIAKKQKASQRITKGQSALKVIPEAQRAPQEIPMEQSAPLEILIGQSPPLGIYFGQSTLQGFPIGQSAPLGIPIGQSSPLGLIIGQSALQEVPRRKSVARRIHKGPKHYCCSECGKFFSYQSGLSRHRRIHRVKK